MDITTTKLVDNLLLLRVNFFQIRAGYHAAVMCISISDARSLKRNPRIYGTSYRIYKAPCLKCSTENYFQRVAWEVWEFIAC